MYTHTLLIRRRGKPGYRVPLSSSVQIGAHAELAIDDALAGDPHGEIILSGGSFWYRDFCTPAGTRLNGIRMTEFTGGMSKAVLLTPGTVLQIGSTELIFDAPEEDSPRTAILPPGSPAPKPAPEPVQDPPLTRTRREPAADRKPKPASGKAAAAVRKRRIRKDRLLTGLCGVILLVLLSGILHLFLHKQPEPPVPDTVEMTSGTDAASVGRVLTDGAEYITLQADPSDASAAVARLYPDDAVEVDSLKNGWYHCQFEGIEGYLPLESVVFRSEEAAETAPETTAAPVQSGSNDNGIVLAADVTVGTAMPASAEVHSCDLYGHIVAAPDARVVGYTGDYVVGHGPAQEVTDPAHPEGLRDGYAFYAVSFCESMDMLWYEVCSAEDGAYWGWVDSHYLTIID